MAVYYKGREINEIGYVKVEENIIEVNNQNKTIDITENGTQTITYDEGYTGLESIVINTNIETSSGGVEIADDTKFGYSTWTELPSFVIPYLETQTDMSDMFTYCTNLTSLDLSSFDTSNVTNMSRMFYYCTGLTSLDLSSFDTSNVTNMNNIFYNCNSLTSLDVNNFDTSNVTNISYMFNNCRRLTSLDLSNWNTSNVTNMTYMFYYCSGLTSLDLSSFDTSNVTNMSYMFSYCSSLTTLNVSGWNISRVTSYTRMFRSCNSLTSLILGDVTQEQYDWWLARLTDEGIQNKVTITYNLIS